MALVARLAVEEVLAFRVQIADYLAFHAEIVAEFLPAVGALFVHKLRLVAVAAPNVHRVHVAVVRFEAVVAALAGVEFGAGLALYLTAGYSVRAPNRFRQAVDFVDSGRKRLQS